MWRTTVALVRALELKRRDAERSDSDLHNVVAAILPIVVFGGGALVFGGLLWFGSLAAGHVAVVLLGDWAFTPGHVAGALSVAFAAVWLLAAVIKGLAGLEPTRPYKHGDII